MPTRLVVAVLFLAGCAVDRTGLRGADASIADGGGTDAGLDAPPSDLPGADVPISPDDLGPPDLGPPDLGPPDLGPPDLGPPDLGCPTFYRDADGDDHGDPAMPLVTCSMADDYAAVGDDCNDSDIAIHPGAVEFCDGRDQNCDGTIDETASCTGCIVSMNAGHTYLFCNQNHSFNYSEGVCTGFGYHLATIEDEPEDTWVAATARAINATGWWIGYTEMGSPYHWLAGTSTYTGWGPGEPSHGTEHCALEAWTGGTAHSWNDADCGGFFPFVCEVPP